MDPTVSIVVPVQEHACLGTTLDALGNQTGISHDEYEIIVVDSLHLYDWTQTVDSFRSRFPDLKTELLVLAESGSRARQLNAGIAIARAPWLLLLADDFIPSPAVVRLHLQAHIQDPDSRLVAMGPGLFRQDSSTTEFMHWLEDSGALFGVPFTRRDLVELPPHYFYMANTSLSRQLLERAGPFDEDFPYDAMDDLEMGWRLRSLGMRTCYLPDAVATHEHIVSFQERCQTMEKAGESAAIFDRKSDSPGPWQKLVSMPGARLSARRKENREQRYRRILNQHFRLGYKRAMNR
jgi:GT2 family glycosyltransferase